MPARVFVTRRISAAGVELLEEGGAEVRVWPGPEDAGPGREELEEGARWADVLLSLLTESVDHALLAGAPRLRGVANMAVGFDNVDVETATEMGVPVSNTPGILTDTTADLTWALLLGAARHVAAGDRLMRAGGYRIWGPNLLLGEDLSRGGDGRCKVLGVVGFGRIGRAVARRALGFDMRVLAHDPHARSEIEADEGAEWADLDALLAESDFVTLHCALTAETRHLIGAPELRRMKSTAVLVNAARGPIVDEAALVEALRGGAIAAAGLDVYENEPSMAAGLAELDNVLLLPHLGSASRATRERMATMAAANALAMIAGERAPNCVNPQVYDTVAYVARRRGENQGR